MEIHLNDSRLRVEYPGAIYHLMSRGVQRAEIFRDDVDRQAFFDRCRETVARFDWKVFATTLMSNHFHLAFQTPEPNLSKGAQFLLGPYAQWFNRRHGRSGHLFESRFRCRIIQNMTYLWEVTRYDHLNPVPTLVEHPAAWPWSSYPGYVDPARRLDWVAYEEFLEAWIAEFGGTGQTYCDYVEAGMRRGNPRPVAVPIDGWIIGDSSFAAGIRAKVSPNSREPTVVRVRRTRFEVQDVVRAVSAEFGVPVHLLGQRGSRHPARRALALLAKEVSTATYQEIAARLGLSRRDSVPNLIKAARAEQDPDWQARLAAIQRRLERQS